MFNVTLPKCSYKINGQNFPVPAHNNDNRNILNILYVTLYVYSIN